MNGQLSGRRILALLMAVTAVGLIFTATQLEWVRVDSRVDVNLSFESVGAGLNLDQSAHLEPGDQKVVAGWAVAMLTCALITLVPYLRIAGLFVVALGALCVATGIGALSWTNKPAEGLLDGRFETFVVDVTPGPGPYVLILGGCVGVMSGLVTLLTQRRVGMRTATAAVPYHFP